MFVFGGITDRNGFNGEPLAKVNDEERMFILITHVMRCLIFNFKMYMHVIFQDRYDSYNSDGDADRGYATQDITRCER
jgi:hypothetical protein